MGDFKQREFRAFHGFQTEPRTMPVASQWTVATIHPSGIIRGFNRNHPKAGTTTLSHRGGR